MRVPALFAALSLATSPAYADRYDQMVAKVAQMTSDDTAISIAAKYKLNILDVLWEDTGRWQGSSVGPNISDVTIEVEGFRKGKEHHTYLMPVMRHDNFTDKTADIKIDRILVPVGNQTANGQLKLVSLHELLANPEQYMSTHGKGKIKSASLLAKRDTHVLVSAQHAFLPVPKDGKATFWPVIFNYQSSRKNPAVLTILVTRQGTSMTIIDNARDTIGGESWGQRLYFNQGGKKAPLIAERLTDVKEKGTTANGEDAQSLGKDANVLMMIQVPLKYHEQRRAMLAEDEALPPPPPPAKASSIAAPSALAKDKAGDRPDVDTAVLGHGPTEGPYTELDGLSIERDARFPVRVTLQFYQATSNGVVGAANLREMAAQIKKVYGKGDYVGSLVVPTELDRQRPTNWDGVTTRPDGVTWTDFPGLVERFGMGWAMRPRAGVAM